MQRVRSWTVQNETRGVLGRGSMWTLDSVNPREIGTLKKAVPVAA